MTIRFSIIIPVYNRPDELNELLESIENCLAREQSSGPKSGTTSSAIPEDNVEVIVVEDGSRILSENVCQHYTKSLNLRYLYQKNAGPAVARNTGARSARGEWLLFFDSDCLIPEGYFDAITREVSTESFDLFGGPDRAAANFSTIQKAIDYTMTSFLTTGGIRGGRRIMDHYYPRSFNMGVRRDAFEKVKGFSGLRFGEDLDLSMRLVTSGYRSVLLEAAWVYHKRRTDLKKFFKQVYNSGMARIVLNQLHPGTLKTVHLLPTLFVVYLVAALVSIPLLSYILWVPIGILLLILIVDGLISTGDMQTALIVPAASIVQLTGYGIGLIHAFILVHLMGNKEANAFKETFYK